MGQRLGQHFLKHGWAARALAHAVAPRPGEAIVEIGPGKGILTRELLSLGPVVAVEKDEVLVERLQEEFKDEIATGTLRLFSDDVRNITPESLGVRQYVVAANIPYYITGEIIRQFLTSLTQPRAMALLVQKEVAQRIVSEKASLLSLSVRAYGRPRIVEKVSRTHFSPPPKVDSAILLIDDISRDFFSHVEEGAFFELLHRAFASKRKQLQNNLESYGKERVARAFEHCGIAPKARAEDVALEQWKMLFLELQRGTEHRDADAGPHVDRKD